MVQSQFVLGWFNLHCVKLRNCFHVQRNDEKIGAGVWGSVGFHADMGMSTCPKARVLIPSSNIYRFVSKGAKATLCTYAAHMSHL